MKLTESQRKKVIKFAKSLIEDNREHPGAMEIKELDAIESELTGSLEELKDTFIFNLLVEMDNTIGTSDPLYKSAEKLVDRLEIIEKMLPNIFKQWKLKLGL